MEQIVITHRDGTTLTLHSRRAVLGVTAAYQRMELLGTDTLNLTIQSAYALDLQVGDKTTVAGKTYTLNQTPQVNKQGSRKYEYTVTMEGVQYELLSAQWLLPDDTVLDSFTGTLEDFIDILISNVDRIAPSQWTKGEVPETDVKTLTYYDTNCLKVLQDLCEQFGTEFEIAEDGDARVLNIRTAGSQFAYKFKYGRLGALYKLTRTASDEDNVITRLYAYGGSTNVPSKYRYSRICLPDKEKNESYLEDADAITAYGTREDTQEFEDIYPKRYGTVTAVDSSDVLSFTDSSMDFDLNETDSYGNTRWLIDGTPARVTFTTGQLAGYSFDLASYDADTKTIHLNSFTDKNGRVFPSEDSAAFQIGVGDTYFFEDIMLPDSYVTAAETELQTKAQEYLDKYKAPMAVYTLEIDPAALRTMTGATSPDTMLFKPGDLIPIEDSGLGIDRSVRVTALTRDLITDYKYSLTLGDAVPVSAVQSLLNGIGSLQQDIRDGSVRGKAGKDAYTYTIESSSGVIFNDKEDGTVWQTTLTARVYKGGKEITEGVTYKWSMQDGSQSTVTSFTDPASKTLTFTSTSFPDDDVAKFHCDITTIN